MKLIDKEGRLFGWINIIDLLVVIFLLSLVQMVYFGKKISTYKPPSLPITYYEITKPCPICGLPIKIRVDKGKLPPEEYKTICQWCENEIYLIKKPITPQPLGKK
ncbi:MAG: DUF4330 family protein [Burkholderiales bacterium]|nr:MAG: DUF4330 family protein [Burkholderiales bacterium]